MNVLRIVQLHRTVKSSIEDVKFTSHSKIGLGIRRWMIERIQSIWEDGIGKRIWKCRVWDFHCLDNFINSHVCKCGIHIT